MATTNEKIHALLVDEEMARRIVSPLIDNILSTSDQAYLGACQEILLAFKDYMVGVKELTDLLKLRITELPNYRITDSEERAGVVGYVVKADNTKAPDTERSIIFRFIEFSCK